MKKNFQRIAVVLFAAVFAFGMFTCSDDPGTSRGGGGGSGTLTGTVRIPIHVSDYLSVVVDVDQLNDRNTGNLKFLWQSKTPDGEWVDIDGVSGPTLSATIIMNRLFPEDSIRVKVTHIERSGEITSNEGIVKDGIIGNVEIILDPEVDADELRLEAGKTYTFSAAVEVSLGDPNSFQEVIWSIGNAKNPNTTIGKYSGVLSLSAAELDGSITITATSNVDRTKNDQKGMVVGSVSTVLNVPIQRVAIIDRTKFPHATNGVMGNDMNSGPDAFGKFSGNDDEDPTYKMSDPATPVPITLGPTGYYFENSKVPEGGADARNELYFYLDHTINVSSYKYLTYEIAADSYDKINFGGHYPRFIKQAATEPATGTDILSQLEVNASAWRLVIDPFSDNLQYQFDPGTWYRIVIDLTTSTIHEPQGDAARLNTVLGSLDVIALRFVNGSDRLPIDGKVYFRNLQFHLNDAPPYGPVPAN